MPNVSQLDFDVAGSKACLAVATSEKSPVSGSAEAIETPRVLVGVESLSISKILRHMLSAMEWQVSEAHDAEDVTCMVRRNPMPHAILLDFAMPKAIEVCQALKKDDRCQLIPLVAITADDSTASKMRAIDAGADDFLSQPINRAELTVRLRTLLRIHKFNQELIGVENVALALARAVAAKDGYAHRHVEEVATFAEVLGRASGLELAELKMLRYAAILHNVGKIGIPDAVLEKTGPLTPREMALFQQHPRVGCDICAPLKPLKPILPIIRHHKERWDGTGFPDGLRGAEIPLGAQIIGIVNVYVAMTSNRPFRKAMSQSDAISHLREQARSGAHDPKLVELFANCLTARQATDEGSGEPTD